MGRPKLVPRLGESKPLPVKLPSDLALELQAFCEAHFRAQQNEVICRAVAAFIKQELTVADSGMRERFEQARERLSAERMRIAAAEGLRLVEGAGREK
jgi:hypothetical protein